MRAILLIPIYLSVVFLPLALAWAQGRRPRPMLDELATGAGLLALSIILAEFLLLGRFRSVTTRVGTDVVMRAHQLLARSALVLAMVHPFLYRPNQPPSIPGYQTRHMGISYDFVEVWPGIVAFLLLPALVATAIARSHLRSRYEIWRMLHGFGAALIAAFGVLHALRAGRYSDDPTLAAVWIGMLVVALSALAYVYVLKPLLTLRHPWTVQSVTPVALKTWELSLKPARKFTFPFRAGQFAWLNVGHSAFSLNENPFSISSAPSDTGKISFIIKELGDFTNTVGSIRPGTRAYIDGPHGHLTIAGHDAPGVALIAGGVGIAPMIGIMRELGATGDKRPVTLLYGNRVEDQIACRAELEQMSKRANTNIVHILSDPPAGWTGETGIVSPKVLSAHFGQPQHKDWVYVLCGPPKMLEAVEDALIDIGVAPAQILSERFSYD
ncbi:ferredoxin reductase family protein [Actibacterium lipolyticum]|uniref:Xylene monooxygenase electron transfer component n=1 Tax=Actibacterium lipolyticum TaxID=1524263 RepID=A0A238JQK7_9RHOB|nr:ferredoxin reductase family protein [Actibacterium lipolyticum]SMX32743.1 Xylene monooxygenase electron transfer component [Actibacterium lipolyticum]